MMDRSRLNLATQPFVNRRPALRLAILLWVVAVGLTAFNLSLYLSRLPGASLTPEQQSQVRAEIGELRQEVRELREELASYDLAELNAMAAFVNRRIAARTFAWSDLFDDLSETMPYHVKLVSLEPEHLGGGRSPGREKSVASVLLQIRGVAQNSAAILEFVDSLYEHERFRGANLLGERTNDDGEVDFTLSTTYRRVPAGRAGEEPTTADGDSEVAETESSAEESASPPEAAP